MNSELAIKNAATLYDMRDKMRRLLGDKYAARMKTVGAMLSELARQRNKDVLATAIEISARRGYVGMELWMLMAAVVELTDPSA